MKAGHHILTAHWVNSHPVDEYDYQPDVPMYANEGNELADLAAKEAAMTHQVSDEQMEKLKEEHTKVGSILRRLVAIACQEAAEKPKIPKKTEEEKEALKQRSRWATRLQTAVAMTTHQLRATQGGRWLCVLCFGRSSTANKAKHKWLLTECGSREGLGAGPHPSHSCFLVKGTAVTFCQSCGSWSTSVYRWAQGGVP